MEQIIEIQNLYKSFGNNSVHRGISFSLCKGETLGLLGNSGTGKSVLLRSIIGLESIDQGEILYRGQRIDNLTEEELFPIRTKISYAFQNGALFDSMTVFENIAYPLFEHVHMTEDEATKKVDSILRRMNLPDIKEAMPSDLSGGMQKRVGLARSMALNPDVLLYDEPTAGLDPLNVEMVLDIMKQSKHQGFSGIFVTHDIAAAKKVCDRIVLLNQGKIAFMGTIAEFESSQDPIVKLFLSES